MDQKEIDKKVIEITAKQLNVEKDKIKLESNFVNDLGADSLDTVELVMAIEEAFGVSIPDEDAQNVRTVGDVVKYIVEKKK